MCLSVTWVYTRQSTTGMWSQTVLEKGFVLFLFFWFLFLPLMLSSHCSDDVTCFWCLLKNREAYQPITARILYVYIIPAVSFLHCIFLKRSLIFLASSVPSHPLPFPFITSQCSLWALWIQVYNSSWSVWEIPGEFRALCGWVHDFGT